MDARLVRAGTYAALAAAMALAAGAAGFAAGRGTAGADRAFDAGWAAGEASARDAANARYGEGGAAREAIRRRAYRRGHANGFRAGRRTGYAAGRRDGIRTGERAIFAGFAGGWRVGGWYAVRIGHGEGARGYSIPARLALSPRRSYRVCGGALCTGSELR